MQSVIVALDLSTRDQALDLVDRLGERATFYKVGSQLFTRVGPDLVRELKAREKRVFLDLKYHDIPNSVARAVEAATDLGVDMLTLHASGGSTMLEAAREAAGDDGPALLGVTLLTSFTAADVEAVWNKEIRSMRDEVARLAAIAAAAGLTGVVASPLEVEGLKRKYGPAFLVVTPGIRPVGELDGDQVRTASPAAAVRAGADYLVVGRPVYAAADPVAALDQVLDQVAEGEGMEAAT
jgi:orotidine-5'-phosphate decarboxylase